MTAEETKLLCELCQSNNLTPLGSFDKGKGIVEYRYRCDDCGHVGVSGRTVAKPAE